MKANAAFAEKFHLPYPLLCDTTREIGMKYGATDSPEGGGAKRITYVIGPDGVIQQAIENVKAAEHPASLLESLHHV